GRGGPAGGPPRARSRRRGRRTARLHRVPQPPRERPRFAGRARLPGAAAAGAAGRRATARGDRVVHTAARGALPGAARVPGATAWLRRRAVVPDRATRAPTCFNAPLEAFAGQLGTLITPHVYNVPRSPPEQSSGTLYTRFARHPRSKR